MRSTVNRTNFNHDKQSSHNSTATNSSDNSLDFRVTNSRHHAQHAIVRAHTNIALIKYWGKKDPQLRLPFTSSISMTLRDFYTDTAFIIEPHSSDPTFILNGKPAPKNEAHRVFEYIDTLYRRFGIEADHSFSIISHNHVPTGAGLASSASAFAALAGAFAQAYECDCDKTELSRMARLGSGSATRSIFGGFVQWQRGTNDETSIAVPIEEYPRVDMAMIAVQINGQRKAISSTEGMCRAVETSPYYPQWVENTENACECMCDAITAEDFTQIGTLAQQSALDMHAINFTARPGFTYFQPETLRAMELVEKLKNRGVECYFTIDAGPNVKILARGDNVEEIVKELKNELPGAKVTTTTFGPGIQYLYGDPRNI